MITGSPVEPSFSIDKPHSYRIPHIHLLINSRSQASHFLRGLTSTRLATVLALGDAFDTSIPFSGTELLWLAFCGYYQSQRWFSQIPEMALNHNRISRNWLSRIRSPRFKEDLMSSFQVRLQDWLRLNFPQEGFFIYGGIKTESSIERKIITQQRRRGSNGQPPELFDIVRFRIVVPGIVELIMLSKLFYEYFGDHLIHCRSYYRRPKRNQPAYPYRAKHFHIIDQRGNIVEVQIMTRYREAVCLFDHPYSYKKILPFSSKYHQRWLYEWSIKANIYEIARALEASSRDQIHNGFEVTKTLWTGADRSTYLN